MTKGELNNFKPGRGRPHCAVLARPQYDPAQELLYTVPLTGIKEPHNKFLLLYTPST